MRGESHLNSNPSAVWGGWEGGVVVVLTTSLCPLLAARGFIHPVGCGHMSPSPGPFPHLIPPINGSQTGLEPGSPGDWKSGGGRRAAGGRRGAVGSGRLGAKPTAAGRTVMSFFSLFLSCPCSPPAAAQCVKSSPRAWSLSWARPPARPPAPSSATSVGRRR